VKGQRYFRLRVFQRSLPTRRGVYFGRPESVFCFSVVPREPTGTYRSRFRAGRVTFGTVDDDDDDFFVRRSRFFGGREALIGSVTDARRWRTVTFPTFRRLQRSHVRSAEIKTSINTTTSVSFVRFAYWLTISSLFFAYRRRKFVSIRTIERAIFLARVIFLLGRNPVSV